MPNVYDFSATTITGKEVAIADYKDKVLLVVNTASKCGLTPQFKDLEALYEKYKDQGLMILGFPCNQFLSQDPASNDEISEFCQLNYGVSFPMFAKIDVNGDDTHAFFQHLKEAAPGLFGINAVKWNFTKFLVDKKGNVIERYAPTTEPLSIAKDIEKLL